MDINAFYGDVIMANVRDFIRPPLLVIPEEAGDDEIIIAPQNSPSDSSAKESWVSKVDSMGPTGGYRYR
jgi:hypothetical protein